MLPGRRSSARQAQATATSSTDGMNLIVHRSAIRKGNREDESFTFRNCENFTAPKR
jgi:hypothetical protein